MSLLKKRVVTNEENKENSAPSTKRPKNDSSNHVILKSQDSMENKKMCNEILNQNPEEPKPVWPDDPSFVFCQSLMGLQLVFVGEITLTGCKTEQADFFDGSNHGHSGFGRKSISFDSISSQLPF